MGFVERVFLHGIREGRGLDTNEGGWRHVSLGALQGSKVVVSAHWGHSEISSHIVGEYVIIFISASSACVHFPGAYLQCEQPN